MNENMMIHETILGSIMSAYKDLQSVKNAVEDKDANNAEKLKKARRDNPLLGSTSISKAASNMTLVFPVICSRGINIENSSMITKALEKNAVTMLQRLFAAYQVAEDQDLQSYIQKFHNNISSGVASLDDIYKLALGESVKLVEAVTTADIAAVKADMKNINFFLPDAINESSLMDYTIREGAADKKSVISQEERRRDYEEKRQRELKKDREHDEDRDYELKHRAKRDKEHDEDRDYELAHRSKRDKEHDEDRDYELKNRNKRDREHDEDRQLQSKKDLHDMRMSKDAAEFFAKQVPDTDFKKANELVPTMMTVSFKIINKDGNKVDDYANALVGVKAKLYPVASNDIIQHITDKNANRNWLTNFFRATTREISFLKDFVLAVDKAKLDAQSMSSRNPTADRMWKVLERRASNSKFKRLMMSNNNAAAITTLCVSQEEVEYMRKNYNTDLESLNVVRGLFESLNLMAIVIVDETLEVAKFIYDETELMWETISFNHLEREASDNSYKKIVNLMTKMS